MLGAALGIAQGLYGLYNTIKSGNEASDYEARMEKLAKNSPLKKESPEVANYYQQALNNYNENAFKSPYYLETVRQADRGLANNVSNAQTRGEALGMFGKAYQQNMDLKRRGIADVYATKANEFNQLGNATQMKKNEQDQMFDINQQTPYNRIFQLSQLKSQAANNRYNAGLNTLAQGIGNATSYAIADKMYNPELVKDQTDTTSNLPISYKTNANANWGTPFDYKSFNNFSSANPSAWGASTGNFNPLSGNFGLPKKYNPKGFKSVFGNSYPM